MSDTKSINDVKDVEKVEVKITRDMGINEILGRWPQLAEVFNAYGLHCSGCMFAGVDTVETGCRAHGMDEEDIENVVNDLNKRKKEIESE